MESNNYYNREYSSIGGTLVCAKSAFKKPVIDENEMSSFLGLFEGKRNSSESSSSSDSNTGSSVSARSGGGGFFNILGSILAGGLGLATVVAPVLPQLGVGAKSRQEELNAKSEAELKLLNAQSGILEQQAESQKELIIIGAVMLFVVVVTMVVVVKN
ncbi:hypothetical protein [Draconibacterium sp.]|uniref:hypothetical protein n=1 Tax=Draconibacterium sp. TaxID=1965318 RepID=UPI003563DD6F